jgi:hypothetical protein
MTKADAAKAIGKTCAALVKVHNYSPSEADMVMDIFINNLSTTWRASLRQKARGAYEERKKFIERHHASGSNHSPSSTNPDHHVWRDPRPDEPQDTQVCIYCRMTRAECDN